MAELSNGPLGSISGKVGNMVASKWRGISYLRALGKKSTKEASVYQKEVQMKFNLLMDFLSPIRSILELGFINKDTARATGLNLAVKENIEAFADEFPSLELDYAKLVLSTGKLAPISLELTEITAEDKLSIKWKQLGTEIIAGSDSDQLNVLMYSKTQNMHAYFPNAATRSARQALVPVPEAFLADELHVFIFLCTEKKDKTSKSVYLPII